jgi:hypothetical protein
MSGAAVLARARAAGVAVGVEGGNLRLRGAAQPPADLLAELRTHKAELVALLTAPMPEPVTRDPAPEPVTPVTRDPMPTGNRVEAQKTAEIRQFHGGVTPVTPVTRDLSNAGRDERAAPTVPDDADEPPPPVAKAVPGLPYAEWVDGMAEALLANPMYRPVTRCRFGPSHLTRWCGA